MAIPPITVVQAIQLGAAAHAAGSAATAAFSELLRSAADFLSPGPSDRKPADAVSSLGNSSKTSVISDLSVLGEQIASLLSRVHSRILEIVSTNQGTVPAEGISLTQDSAGDLSVSGTGTDGSNLATRLQQDSVLGSLIRSLAARKRLFDSVSTGQESTRPLQLNVNATVARLAS